MAYWLDSHCHINDKESFGDVQEIFNRMVDRGVDRCMIVSLNKEEYEYTKTISDPRIQIKRSIGVYPEHVVNDEKFKQDVYDCFKEVDAIGEIGLDYYWAKESKEIQKKIFIEQIEMAKTLDKPIIVHARDAIQDTYDILKQHQTRGVLHCYSASAEMAKEFVKLGYYISIAGTVTFKNAKEPLEVIQAIPLDHLLIETDSPYLTPVPHRGKRNEPAYVADTGEFIAKQLHMDEEVLKEQLSANYKKLFGE